jgi:hypothetical protein
LLRRFKRTSIFWNQKALLKRKIHVAHSTVVIENSPRPMWATFVAHPDFLKCVGVMLGCA